MVMIARSERSHVRPCFDSFWDQVDEVVLCDTGSRDGTIGQARTYAREHGEARKLLVGRFRWRDDFAAARTYAHSLATGDVHVTMDLDDRLMADGNDLRDAAARLIASPKAGAVVALWSGPRTPGQWRPRLLRAPVIWDGPTWEQPAFDAALITRRLRWHHTRECSRGTRDLDIALGWARREPANDRPMLAAASEARGLEDWPMVKQCCERALALSGLGSGPRTHLSLLLGEAELYSSHNYTAAERLAEQVIEIAGDTLTRRQFDASRGPGIKSLDVNGTVHGAWSLLAVIAFRRREWERALLCVTWACEYALSPDRLVEPRAIGFAAIGELLKQTRDPERVERLVDEVLLEVAKPRRRRRRSTAERPLAGAAEGPSSA